MDLLGIVFLLLLPGLYSHTPFNISLVPTIISPHSCTGNTFLVIIIHTNPLHNTLRDKLRKTWASHENVEVNVKRVFVVGEVEDESLATSLVDESDKYGDILQVRYCFSDTCI